MIGREEPLRIVIVGGVAGGATAAARARRCNATATITMLEKGPAVSFANCGLPYHVGGEIAERKKLLVATPELFRDRFQVDVRTQCEVQSIDRSARTVSGIDHGSGQPFMLPYDRLIVSTGSEPLRPPFMATPLSNMFQLWTLPDLDHVMACIQQMSPRKAVVVGAGFVGLEVVEQLERLGMQVTLVERGDHVLKPLDSELATLIEHELTAHGVQLALGSGVEQVISEAGRAVAVELTGGRRIECDLLIVGAGVRSRTELAKAAGLTIGQSGGVAVNEFMQTSDPLIYAVGDMTEVRHGVLDKPQRIPLAGPANRAGRVAGAHAATGHSSPAGNVLGTSIVRVFDLVAAATGLNERTCVALGIDHHIATIQANDHAGYYPGAKELTIKLIYAPEDGRILGAQVVGQAGVDKRIDVIATLMHFKGTVHDLAQLDLAYAPPFGSAKDPVHMAAFVAQNDLQNYPRLADTAIDLSGYQVVDVRSNAELERLPAVAGARHIPIDHLGQRWQELDPLAPTVVICHSGKRAHIGACWLAGQGFQQVQNLNGGMSIRRLCPTTNETRQ
ncbi:MAG: FAD-dependent oxidoreductase [Pirellulaceae bacterium]|nr:FAD-dependent oxidoreductase [Pirellulaceae bacterium]